MIELLLLSIALVGTLICGLYDLKTTNIPDEVCYAMIGLAVFIHSVESYMIGSINPILHSLISGGFLFAISYAFYKLGIWGGGDGELVVAIGMLISTTNAFFSTAYPFPISFLINSFIIGAFYALIYSFVIFIRNDNLIKCFYQDLKKQEKIISIIFAGSILMMIILSTIRFSHIVIAMGLLLIAFPILNTFAKVVEKKGFYKKIPVSKLKADDMLGEDIPKLKLFKKEIRGLTKEEVRKIKKLKKFVIIREGVRYGPAFFLTLILMLIFGDILNLLIYYI